MLRYDGRVVSAPYHSACGGETASPEEVWRSTAEPYLKRVSDRIPGTADRYYCDVAPRFAWTRVLTGDELDAALRSYLQELRAGAGDRPRAGSRGDRRRAHARAGASAGSRSTPIAGRFALRGNDVRYVLRSPVARSSTAPTFPVEAESRRDGGALRRLVIRGNGYGHGIGMCQWGAIGRARAGHSFARHPHRVLSGRRASDTVN